MMTCPNCKSKNYQEIYFPGIQGCQGQRPNRDCYSCCDCGVRFDDVRGLSNQSGDEEEIITYTYDEIISDQIISNLRGFSSLFKQDFINSQSPSVMSMYGHFYKEDFNSSLIVESNNYIENGSNSMFFFLAGGGSFMVSNPIGWDGWGDNDISIDKLRVGARKDIRIRTEKKYKNNYPLSMVRQKIRYGLHISHRSTTHVCINEFIYNLRMKFPIWQMNIQSEITGPDGESTRISFYLRDKS